MEELLKELNKQKALVILAESEAGKTLVDELKNSCEDLLGVILYQFSTITHLQLMTLLIELKGYKEFVNQISNSKEQVEILSEEYNKLIK